MIDFDGWLEGQNIRVIAPYLPDGVIEADGRYFAECCCCGEFTELPVDISEVPMEGYEHYCGGSPRCCP